jgi:hypothetical protein
LKYFFEQFFVRLSGSLCIKITILQFFDLINLASFILHDDECFAQHLQSVTQDNSLPVANNFNFPGHSSMDMKITGLVACVSSNRNRYQLDSAPGCQGTPW